MKETSTSRRVRVSLGAYPQKGRRSTGQSALKLPSWRSVPFSESSTAAGLPSATSTRLPATISSLLSTTSSALVSSPYPPPPPPYPPPSTTSDKKRKGDTDDQEGCRGTDQAGARRERASKDVPISLSNVNSVPLGPGWAFNDVPVFLSDANTTPLERKRRRF